jgi:lipoic acid synthetase
MTEVKAGEAQQPLEPMRRPPWLKIRINDGPNYRELKGLMRGMSLHTVCEEARCPNIGECWEHRTATFLILGRFCTRACSFCAVEAGRPGALDWDEPARVARTAQSLGLRYVVVTSVTRDDIPDGGAGVFAATIREIRAHVPDCAVEVLIPDFKGSPSALQTVIDALPDVLNHNIETVPRLYRAVRPKAKYDRSLQLLRDVRRLAPTMLAKSGIMVGLGETTEEILRTMADIRATGCDILTIGQYLRPSLKHHPVVRYYSPAEFTFFREEGERLGFRHVESAPLVRSSYHAHRQVDDMQ